MKIKDIVESLTKPAKKLPGAMGRIQVTNIEDFAGASPDQEVDEAVELNPPHREMGNQEYQDYMKRIVGTPNVDPETGEPILSKEKVNKAGKVVPGKPTYTTGKTKTDKYKMPYIHRSSALKFYDPDGNEFSEEAIKTALKVRPSHLLKQNEKMKHSNGAFEQFFNIGFAALTGIAVDESANKLIIVNTCPGAGSCKVDCFAMGGGKVQFENAWLSDGKILTYLLNDPQSFYNQLDGEIKHEVALGQKGFKVEKGATERTQYTVCIRWHDAGDFFSPEYMALAFKLAEANPDVKFYAYTKMAGAVLAKKPDNFIINWSEGAHTSQEKQVKAQDPRMHKTKNSRIIPNNLFYDLLVKDAKKNLVKSADGAWQIQPDKLPELKHRIAKAYGLSAHSILSYAEWDAKTQGGKINTPMKYNVIICPGEPDITANSHGVISTLLLKH